MSDFIRGSGALGDAALVDSALETALALVGASWAMLQEAAGDAEARGQVWRSRGVRLERAQPAGAAPWTACVERRETLVVSVGAGEAGDFLPDGIEAPRWLACVPVAVDRNAVGALVLGLVDTEPAESGLLALQAVAGELGRETLARRSRRASRERGALVEAMRRATGDALIEVDEEGGIVAVNEAAVVLYGYDRSEFVGLQVGDLDVVETAHETAMHMARIRVLGFDRFETLHRRKDGSHFECEASVTFVGASPAYVAAIRDISARRRAESELRESRERLSNILQNAGAGYFRFDAQGFLVEVNAAWLEMHGYESAREVMGRHFSFTQVAGDLARAEEIVRMILEGKAVPPGDFSRLNRDGSVGYHSFTVQPVIEHGRVAGFEGFLIDRTELRRAQDDLHTTFERMIDAFALHEIICDEEGRPTDYRFLSVNPAFERLTGLKAENVIGRTVREVLPGTETAWIERYGRVARTGEPETFEEYSADLGRWFEVSAYRPKKGRFACMFVDATARIEAERHLRESEERYRAVVATMTEGILVLDCAGMVIDCNTSAERTLGLTRGDIVGRPCLESLGSRWNAVREDGLPFPDEEHPGLVALRERRSVRAVVVGLETADGRRRWLNVNAEPLTRAGEAGPFGAAVSFTDITERRSSEERLRQLSRAIEQNPASIVITDTSGRIEYVNARFTTVSGYRSEEVIGATPALLKSGKQSREFYRNLWETLKAGREWRGEFHNRRKDGGLFWESATIAPIFDDGGRITHFLAIKEDVTEQRKADEQIREQAALLDVSTDAILVLNLARQVTYCNRSVEHIYGWAPDEMKGRHFEQMVCGPSGGASQSEIEQFLRQGVAISTDRHFTKKGSPIDVKVRATLLRTESGAPKAIFVVVSDITEAKRVESQFLRAQRLESLGSLAGGVAHDLNNVLTPIMMSADVLQGSLQSDQDREILDLVKDSARRGADIVRQLLLFGRGSDTPRTNVDACEIVNDVSRMMRETFPRNLRIDLRCKGDLWLIHADRTQVHQVLLNLCVNARDAMAEGGEIVLSAENVTLDESFASENPDARVGPYVRIRVADTGSGIPAEIIDKVFDPFFTTKPQGQGTGLGLATVLGIVRGHHGFVSVRSEVGVGSEFSVHFPANPSARQVKAGDESRARLRGRGELILAIDDEDSIRDLIARVLPSNNYTLLVAQDGTEGIATFAQNSERVRLVITDMMMPVMDGAQTILALRRLRPGLPVVAVSGLQRQKAEVERFGNPGVVFLAKPFTVDELLHAVRQALDGVETA